MKPIKFRAKSKLTNDWIYGSLIKQNISNVRLRYQIYNDDRAAFQHDVYPDTIGQLVTVQDGQEIYEGDLVEQNYMDEGVEHTSLFPIVWDALYLYWAIDTSFEKNGLHLTSLSEWFGTVLIKINGNIHDQKIII